VVLKLGYGAAIAEAGNLLIDTPVYVTNTFIITSKLSCSQFLLKYSNRSLPLILCSVNSHRLCCFPFSVGESERARSEEDGISLTTADDEYLLDFGCDNGLGQPISMLLLVVNTSAIPTAIVAAVSHFVAANVPPSRGMYIACFILVNRCPLLAVMCTERTILVQRRYDMRHEMLTQRALFCIDVMAKRVTLSQHFMAHVVPPLILANSMHYSSQ
jgi:hypothetical protein